jgi:uncharacterized SAM-binding protein YcdF (DUF218 family)
MIRRLFITFLLCVIAVWLAGFVAFTFEVEKTTAINLDPDTPPTDAIVVLTGGSERVAEGIHLLKEGKARKLLISGVHEKLTLDHILADQNVPKDLRDCCVTLGYEAENTHGNATETRTWLTLENAKSIYLVTANYHMPRSLLIFHATIPNILILPHPVTPDNVKIDAWWMYPGTASLLMSEYNKYLGTNLRLWLEH